MSKASFLRFSFVFAAATFLTVSAAEAAGPLQFYSVTPCRLMDTRDPNGLTGGPVLTHGVIRNLAVYGSNARPCLISTSAKAVSVNLTVVGPTNLGHLTAFPYNTTVPIVSNLNYSAGEPALGNGAIVPLAVDSSFQISFLPVLGGGVGTVHLVVDITGYFQ